MAKFLHPTITDGSISIGTSFVPVCAGVLELDLSVAMPLIAAGVGLVRVSDDEAAEFAARMSAAQQQKEQ